MTNISSGKIYQVAAAMMGCQDVARKRGETRGKMQKLEERGKGKPIGRERCRSGGKREIGRTLRNEGKRCGTGDEGERMLKLLAYKMKMKRKRERSVDAGRLLIAGGKRGRKRQEKTLGC